MTATWTRLHPVVERTAAPDELVTAVSELLQAGWRLALVAGHDDGQSGAGGAGGEREPGDPSDPGDPDGERAPGDPAYGLAWPTGSLRIVYVFLRPVGQRAELTVTLPRDDPRVPSLAGLSYPAGRFERELRDLLGIEPVGHPLPARLVHHGHWPEGWHPLRHDAGATPALPPDHAAYPFVRVAGDGVYEIPVGPIHAGLIEPGHFRFSVVGETILRMKARLWFVHRGMERLFQGREPAHGIELAERISGDTAVGHCLAYALAVEDALGIAVPLVVARRRAVLLELERLHNHIADLGAIANDVGFGIAMAHAQRLREQLLRHNARVTGHRLLRGAIGIGTTELAGPVDVALVAAVAEQAAELAQLTTDHSVIADRFTGTAVLPAEKARQLGTLGYVARASGIDADARVEHPWADLGPAFAPVAEASGDVAARYAVRVREIAVSAAVITRLVAQLDSTEDLVGAEGAGSGARGGASPEAPPGAPMRAAGSGSAGLGVVEAWRGTLCHRVELDGAGRLTRVKIVDPSFFNWPALSVALEDTIVPDFPLANKSFNQSYAGNDL